MKKKLVTVQRPLSLLLIMLLSLLSEIAYSQSPYSIAPKWYFGRRAGIDFTSGTPAVMAGSLVNGTGQEASSTMVDSAGNVLFYSDSYRLYNGNNSFNQFVNGGTSSSNAGVSFPDPADPDNFYYYVSANQDLGGGGENGATVGIYWYRIQKTGTGTISVVAGPTLLAGNNEVSEQLYASPDNNGGYRVVAHQGGGTNGNQFWSWNFTSTGVGARQISSVAGTETGNTWQGSIKINKCQNRLAAAYWTGRVEVYDWDNASGQVTALYRSYQLPSAFVYGCEFSPDGNTLYFTSLVGNQLYQFDLIGNGVAALVGGTSANNVNEMGTLQIGPDDKIYVTNVGNFGLPAYVGVVNNPNVVGVGCNYDRQGFVLNTTASFTPNIYRGISNQAWINPRLDLDTIGNCRTLVFAYDFRTYYNDNISIVANSQTWDFGDGSGVQSGLGATPSHTYASGGTYTITFTVTDVTCNKVWTETTTISVNGCGTPPPFCLTPITAVILPNNSSTVLDLTTPLATNFSGTSSSFDAANTAPEEYYWSVGTPPTDAVFEANTDQFPLTFQYNGANGNLAQGTYTIYLLIQQGFCSSLVSTTYNAIYTAPPTSCVIPIEAIISGEANVLLEGNSLSTVSFTGAPSNFNSASSDPKIYYWSLGEPSTSNVISTSETTSLTFANNGIGGVLPQGEYVLNLIINQGPFCSDTIQFTLNVTRFFIPNLVTPNRDEKNDRFDISNTAGRFDLEVYNRWGDRVHKETGYTNGWEVENINDGIYFYYITDVLSNESYKGWVQIVH